MVAAVLISFTLFEVIHLFRGRETDKSLLFGEVYKVQMLSTKPKAQVCQSVQTDAELDRRTNTNYPDLTDTYHREYANSISEVMESPHKAISPAVKAVVPHITSPVYSPSTVEVKSKGKKRNIFQQGKE